MFFQKSDENNGRTFHHFIRFKSFKYKKDELFSSSFLQLFLIFIDYQFVRFLKRSQH